MRNEVARRETVWGRILRGSPELLGSRAVIRYGEGRVSPGRLVFRRRSAQQTMRLFLLGLFVGLLWWSFGALGSRGELEGGQYRAGRRAPPSGRGS